MLSQSEMYSLAMLVGLSEANAKIAAAVGMAESGGNERAHTKDSDDDSYGLWQINMKGSMGPARVQQFHLKDANDLLRPGVNARVMSIMSNKGANWQPWGAYTNGSYRKYINKKVAKVDVSYLDSEISDVNPSTGPTPDETGEDQGGGGLFSWPGDILDAFAKIGDGVNRTARWVSNQQNWVRILYVAGGSALILASINILARPYLSGAVSKAASVAGNVIPVGKVAKIATASKIAK